MMKRPQDHYYYLLTAQRALFRVFLPLSTRRWHASCVDPGTIPVVEINTAGSVL
jgi:hypothetical protein